MNILYVSLDNTPYSDRSHEILVAEVLADEGHDIDLVCEQKPRWPDGKIPDGINLQVEPVNAYQQAKKIAQRLPRDVDVAFASSVTGAPILDAWQEHGDAPIITQVLDVPLWRINMGTQAPWYKEWQRWMRHLVQQDHLVFNTEQSMAEFDQAADEYGYQNTDLPRESLIYYGIDTEEAIQDHEAPQIEQRIDEADVDCWLVSVSRLVFYKGFDLAMHALNHPFVQDQGEYDYQVGLIIVGAGRDAGRLQQIRELLDVPVVFAGGLSDPDKFAVIEKADAGLFVGWNPSITSLFPTEATYTGTGTILARTPINEEKCRNHGVQYVNPHKTGDIASAIVDAATQVQDGHTYWPGDHSPEQTQAWIEENRSHRSHAKGLLSTFTDFA